MIDSHHGFTDPAVMTEESKELVPGHSLVVFGGRKRACMVCIAQDKRRLDGRSPETVYGCETCQVNLCRVGNCFMKFHSRV